MNRIQDKKPKTAAVRLRPENRLRRTDEGEFLHCRCYLVKCDGIVSLLWRVTKICTVFFRKTNDFYGRPAFCACVK